MVWVRQQKFFLHIRLICRKELICISLPFAQFLCTINTISMTYLSKLKINVNISYLNDKQYICIFLCNMDN